MMRLYWDKSVCCVGVTTGHWKARCWWLTAARHSYYIFRRLVSQLFKLLILKASLRVSVYYRNPKAYNSDLRLCPHPSQLNRTCWPEMVRAGEECCCSAHTCWKPQTKISLYWQRPEILPASLVTRDLVCTCSFTSAGTTGLHVSLSPWCQSNICYDRGHPKCLK